LRLASVSNNTNAESLSPTASNATAETRSCAISDNTQYDVTEAFAVLEVEHAAVE